jgi:hypothetical protein
MASMGNAQRGALGGLAKLGEGARTTSDLSRVGGGLSRGANEGKKLNAAPWSDTFPAAGATLDLDFANNRGFVRGVGQGGVMDAITFTRASNGTFVKPDGTLSTHANQGALGNNLLSFPQDFDNAVWGKFNSIVIPNVESAPNETNTADLLYPTSSGTDRVVGTPLNIISATGQHTASVYVKSSGLNFAYVQINAGVASFVTINLSTGAVGTPQTLVGSPVTSVTSETLNNGWFRLIFTLTATSTANSVVYIGGCDNQNNRQVTANGQSGIFIWGAQLEVGSTATEYFPTNIGEPRFDWASTDSTGAGTIADPRVIPLRANPTSNGILIEEARTNRLLWNRDATQTEWVKTNITAAKDQTGIDGVANAASSLTATDDNGTCIQTITLAAGNRTGSVYLKRLTGTGNIQVTLDGSTYSTVELSDTEWYRIVLSGSVTNPTVGIKIVVDGDAVAMDYGQVEDNLNVTTPILTTTATATRAVDLAQVEGSNFSFFTQQEETSIVEFLGLGVTAGLLLNSANIGNLIIIDNGRARHSNGISNFDTSANYTAGNFGKAAVSGNRTKRVIALNGISTSANFQPVRSTTTVANIRIGGLNAINIKRVIMLPKAVTESALEELTT